MYRVHLQTLCKSVSDLILSTNICYEGSWWKGADAHRGTVSTWESGWNNSGWQVAHSCLELAMSATLWRGPVCTIWIYKNLKISLAYLLTKYSVYFEGWGGVNTKGNKRKGKHILGSTKHTGFRGNCLLQYVPLCWLNQEDTEKEHEGRIEATTAHLQGKKENPGISVSGKPLLEAKQNLDYNQLFTKQLIGYGVQLLTYHQKQ